jgi:hypothetical protein
MIVSFIFFDSSHESGRYLKYFIIVEDNLFINMYPVLLIANDESICLPVKS